MRTWPSLYTTYSLWPKLLDLVMWCGCLIVFPCIISTLLPSSNFNFLEPFGSKENSTQLVYIVIAADTNSFLPYHRSNEELPFIVSWRTWFSVSNSPGWLLSSRSTGFVIPHFAILVHHVHVSQRNFIQEEDAHDGLWPSRQIWELCCNNKTIDMCVSQ